MDIQAQTEFLEKLYDRDQALRVDFHADQSNQQRIELANKIAEQDSLNHGEFLAYIGSYGWPKISVHGRKACNAAFLIIQHGTIEDLNSYLPILAQRAQEGEIHPTCPCLMQDRLLMYQGKPQIYGSQSKLGENGKWYIWPIKNPETVNALRQNSGFPDTVEETAHYMNAIFDPDVKITDFPSIL